MKVSNTNPVCTEQTGLRLSTTFSPRLPAFLQESGKLSRSLSREAVCWRRNRVRRSFQMVVRRLLKQWSEPLWAALCPSLGAHLLEQSILGGSWI